MFYMFQANRRIQKKLWPSGIVMPLVSPTSPPPDLNQAGETGISRTHRRSAWACIAALIAGGCAATPFATIRLIEVPGYLPMFSSAMIVINLILACVLFIKGIAEQASGTVRLGAAYLYVSLIFVPQTMSFPGGIMPDPVIGTAASGLWLWAFWHIGFAAAVIYYACSAGRPIRQRHYPLFCVLAAAAAATAATLVSTTWVDRLPSLLSGGHYLFSGPILVVPFTVAAFAVAAMGSVATLRGRTAEHLWLTVGMVASCVDVWLTLRGGARFALGWYLSKAGSLLSSLAVLVSLIYEITQLYRDAAASNRRLGILARQDALTGLANRRTFDERIAEEFRRARRHDLSLGLVMIDVDYFKHYNDRFGHPAGDECLRRVAAAVRRAVRRAGDLAGRYGGEEIVVLLPATGAFGAREQIRLGVAELVIEHPDSVHGIVTVSAGTSFVIPFDHASVEDLISAADQALYRAKAGGRNQVCEADPHSLAVLLPPLHA